MAQKSGPRHLAAHSEGYNCALPTAHPENDGRDKGVPLTVLPSHREEAR